MKIEHLAIWVDDIELLREFYLKYFNITCGEKYVNTTKNYTAYFLSFDEGSTRLELMHMPNIGDAAERRGFTKGVAHFAISVGGKEAVDALTQRLRNDGYTIAGEPRITGDGYYESVVLDPEGNYVEIAG